LHIRGENIRLIFGLKIKQLRSELKLSLSDVAQQTGISISYLNEIEKGKKYPKPDKINGLATCFHVDYEWLVSLHLTQKLAPIGELIKSDVLSILPLDIFGIEPGDLLEIISNTPTKVSAFISTLIEIARNYDMSVEGFYYSVLRSYQEMHENYFEDIEEIVEEFAAKNNLDFNDLTNDKLRSLLQDQYKYIIDDQNLANFPELLSLRYVIVEKAIKLKCMLINPLLSEQQIRFAYARELGYEFMQIKDRANTFSWVKIKSFDQILNNFKASYFAGAILIPRKHLVEDLESVFSKSQWDEEAFLKLLDKYEASPEMFLHRLTNIASKYFGLSQLFFLKFHHQPFSEEFELNKELHLAGLYNPHGTMLNEHYCRRWAALQVLQELAHMQRALGRSSVQVLCKIQRSQYIGTDKEYLCISLSRPIEPTPKTNSSITIGFLVNDNLKEKIKFWDDPEITIRKVGVACERCSELNCPERVAPPKSLQEEERTLVMLSALKNLEKKMK